MKINSQMICIHSLVDNKFILNHVGTSKVVHNESRITLEVLLWQEDIIYIFFARS